MGKSKEAQSKEAQRRGTPKPGGVLEDPKITFLTIQIYDLARGRCEAMLLAYLDYRCKPHKHSKGVKLTHRITPRKVYPWLSDKEAYSACNNLCNDGIVHVEQDEYGVRHVTLLQAQEARQKAYESRCKEGCFESGGCSEGGKPRPEIGVPRPEGGGCSESGGCSEGGEPRPEGGVPRPEGGEPRPEGGLILKEEDKRNTKRACEENEENEENEEFSLADNPHLEEYVVEGIYDVTRPVTDDVTRPVTDDVTRPVTDDVTSEDLESTLPWGEVFEVQDSTLPISKERPLATPSSAGPPLADLTDYVAGEADSTQLASIKRQHQAKGGQAAKASKTKELTSRVVELTAIWPSENHASAKRVTEHLKAALESGHDYQDIRAGAKKWAAACLPDRRRFLPALHRWLEEARWDMEVPPNLSDAATGSGVRLPSFAQPTPATTKFDYSKKKRRI